MSIIYSGRFLKKFKALNKKVQNRFFERLELFKRNPNNPILKNHPLKGVLMGKRAFSVTGDYRVIFRYSGKMEAKLLDIGRHSQIY